MGRQGEAEDVILFSVLHFLKINFLEETKEEIKKYLETNENKSTKIPNPWDVAKAVLRGKLVVILSYLRKSEKSQINSLNLYIKQREKE